MLREEESCIFKEVQQQTRVYQGLRKKFVYAWFAPLTLPVGSLL